MGDRTRPAGGARSGGAAREVPPALARALLRTTPPWVVDFADRAFEWRRLFAETLGTFLLVMAAAGGGVVAASTGEVSRSAAVVAPGLTVTAVILSIGAVSGAHLNPVVTVAFALRREFPWRRVPLYVVVQVLGAVLACLALWATVGRAGQLGATVPGAHVSDLQAGSVEALLTLGLITTILGTASGAQNVGPLSALAVGGYVALAGLWAGPVTGASMNPARSLGPELVTADLAHAWVYIVGPTVGMLVAVASAWVLRGPGPDPAAVKAAQGTLGAVVVERRPAHPPVPGRQGPDRPPTTPPPGSGTPGEP